MIREDMVRMKVKELRRLHVIRQVMEKKLTQVGAAALVGLTDRQIRRLVRAGAAEGRRGAGAPAAWPALEPPAGRGPEGAGAPNVREPVWGLRADLAAEKMAERHGMTLSKETLRSWLREQGSTILAADGGPIGRGGPANRMWASSCNWTALTMIGWWAVGLALS